MRTVYLDHSATSYVLPEVIDAMLPFFGEHFGNPSSLHAFGRTTRKVLEDCREHVADLMNVEPGEVIFTGGGSEADNCAIIGTLLAMRDKGNHIITSSIEHHAVEHSCNFARKYLGAEVTFIPVDNKARIDLEFLEKAITDKTVLVTIMSANNEVGTIQDLDAISRICFDKGVRFHTDAVQSIGLHDLKLNERQINLASFAAHKFYGPKGIGCLIKRKGYKLVPLIHGGSQEFGLRAGTENLAGIVGLTKALEIAMRDMGENIKRLTALRDKFISGVIDSVPETSLNGDPVNRLPHNASIAFKRIEGESILLQLDMHGVAASSGSACTSSSLNPSHVLTAMGLDPVDIHGSVRFTLGYKTNEEDVDYVLGILPVVVEKLRAITAVY
jgi:cysteine desulfurase